MGIYSTGRIYGIQIYRLRDDDEDDVLMDVLFQRIYPETMTVEQRTEAYDGYMGLPEKDNIRFRVYTDCFTTLEIGNKDVFKRWYPMSLNRFLDKFGADLGPASTETPTP